MNLIEVEELRKQYNPPKGTIAVDCISFQIAEGEIFSLLGPNGAGKTTTISLLSCLLAPSGGEARVGGHSVVTAAREVKQLIGVVPQEIALYPDLTARENLVFWGRMYGMGGPDLERRVDEVLALIGLVDRQKERVDRYSGGMKRRVNIGVALLHEPRMLYLDEPTVGIDPQSRRAILDGIKDLNAQGMTVLYTTHYMEEAEELSDRVGIMDNGKIVALGTKDELVQIIGGQTRIEAATDQGLEAMVDEWLTIDGITTGRVEDGAAVLFATDANAVLPQLFERAAARGRRLSGLHVTEPNLEQVFLHLTGRQLRD
jgi:ABC-2 type transport system ATP-binding protein